MELREQLNGIQHVGIPTNDIEMTIAFYEKLGFEIAFRTDDGIMYLSVDFSALADNTAVDDSVPGNILRTDDITFGIDLPEFLI